jgi:GNAT superfamily N-acetyltransferase
MPVTYTWRGDFKNVEINQLHAEAFQTPVFEEAEWDWRELVDTHSLGWVVARDADKLVGFVNVIWDGRVHGWIVDTMVAAEVARQGVGTQLVVTAIDSARDAGCRWLHVDFDDRLRAFYVDACGFRPTIAGVKALQ